MRPRPIVFVSLALLAPVLGHAQFGYASVTADGGFVAARNSLSGDWSGLEGTAGRAQIQYGSDSGSPTQFKFANADGVANARSFGNTSTVGDTTTQVLGQSDVSTGQDNPTTYYSAEWSSTSSAPADVPVVAGSGTYDPWTVTYGDIQKAGVYSNLGTTSFYYQSSLVTGLFSLQPGQTGAYNYVLGVAGRKFVDLTVRSNGKVDLGFATYDNFSVYLLNPKLVYGPEETIDYRIGNATLLTNANGKSEITNFLNRYLDPDGSLDYRLTFAVVYGGVTLPTYNPANDGTVVVEWNTDTIEAVPEPASLAALGVGALALLRRRSRKAS